MSEGNDHGNASLQDIFLAAMDQSCAAERVAFLDAACGVDTERRRAIEALLANQQNDDFLERPAIEELAERSSSPGSIAEGLEKRISRYKLLEQIGEGGCGVVYVAEQEEPMRRRVALKVIKLGMDTKSVIARFEAERQALALMDHPNIAKVLDAGATETGRPYFVMELVRGIKITDYCDQRKVPTQQRLRLFVQVCQAIQHAHQKGIIHRDIKPSNILITLHDGVPVPKVIDFGIAKATTDQRLTDKTVYTQLQQFIGTPAYMSPEQAEMSGLDIDTRSDIYSLGVLLYEMLVSKTPFDATELLASGLDGIRRTIREQEPMRPSTRVRTMLETDQTTTAHAHGSDVPNLIRLLSGDLDWIVIKCLEKDRARRYDTANGLAMDIQRHLNQEPVLARPPSTAYRVRKFVRRNKLIVGAGSTIAAALLLGTLGSTWQAMRATRAEREQTRLREEAETARAEEARLRSLAEAQAYAADMKAAEVALQQNNRAVTVELLKRYLPEPGEEDLRGLEWRYLWELSRSDEQLEFPHSHVVYTAVFTSGDRQLATIDHLGTLRVWDATSGTRIIETEPRGSAGVILGRRLDCTSDKRWLAAAGNQVVEIWDTSVWRVARTLRGVTHPLRFSPDGRFLATRGTNGLWLWGAEAWTHRELTNALPRTTDLAFSPDGRRLVSASGGDGWGFQIQFWDTETGMEINRIETEGREVISISPDGHWLASGSWTGEVTLWDLASGEPAQQFRAHPIVMSLAFSPDGTRLATGGSDQLIHVWETGTTNRIATFQGHENEIWSFDFSRDGRRLVSSAKDATAKLWDVTEKPTHTQSFVLPTGSAPEGPLPDGSALVTVDSNARMTQLWSLPEGRPLRSLAWSQFEEKGCSDFWHLPANESVIGRTPTGTFHFWSLRTGQHLESVPLAAADAEPVSLSGDGHWLLARSRPEGFLNLYDLRTVQMAKRFEDYDPVPGYPVGSLSPDGRWLAYGTADNAIKIWDLVAHRERATLTGVEWHVVPIQWSPDSKLIAGAGWDGHVCLWSVESGKLLFPPLKGHQAGAKFAIFSSDGKTLITDSDDDITRWWSVATGREVLSIRDSRRIWHRQHVAPAATWDLGGRFLVWQQPQGVIQVMTVPTLAKIDAATSAQRVRNLVAE